MLLTINNLKGRSSFLKPPLFSPHPTSPGIERLPALQTSVCTLPLTAPRACPEKMTTGQAGGHRGASPYHPLQVGFKADTTQFPGLPRTLAVVQGPSPPDSATWSWQSWSPLSLQGSLTTVGSMEIQKGPSCPNFTGKYIINNKKKN